MQDDTSANSGPTYMLFPKEEAIRYTAVIRHQDLHCIWPLKIAVKKFTKFSAHAFSLDYFLQIPAVAKLYRRPVVFSHGQPPINLPS